MPLAAEYFQTIGLEASVALGRGGGGVQSTLVKSTCSGYKLPVLKPGSSSHYLCHSKVVTLLVPQYMS